VSEYVRITDVSPRDGLQNEPGVIPTADKVQLVESLRNTGVDEVEVSSFVSAKWVPQLGDAAQVFEGLNSPSQREGLGFRPIPEGGARGGQRIALRDPARDPVAYARANELRKRMTGPEKHLWHRINAGKIGGLKVRRQHPFGPFILDFYFPESRVAVELDGNSHRGEDRHSHDASRDAYLSRWGVRSLRLSNDGVLYNTGTAIGHIRAACGLGSTNEHTPCPFLGEGSSRQPPPSGRGLPRRPLLSALVPNERGMQDVLDFNARAGSKLIGKVAIFTAASETFALRNTNATIAETIARFRPVVEVARREALEVRAYISCAIACPFEGAIKPEAVVRVAGSLLDVGLDDLDFGDTIGAGTPETVASLLSHFDNEIGIDSLGAITTLHLHDTFGRAAECVKAALDLGVRSFDGSVAGLGGCPYASTPGKRAPGNISTETLVRTVHEAGFTTGVDLDALNAATEYARTIVAKSRAPAPPASSTGGGVSS